MDKQKVSFLCRGNSVRSQMVDAFLRKYEGESFEAYSAGLEPKGMEVYLGKMLFQYLITICDDANKNCPTVWPGVNTRMHWSFEDPAKFEGTEEQKLAKFREVRDLMEKKIKGWVAEQQLVIQ